MSKSNKIFITIVCFVAITLISLSGFLIYDKLIQKDNQTTIIDKTNDENIDYIYNMFGDDICIYISSKNLAFVSDNKSSNFYTGLYRINLLDKSVKKVYSAYRKIEYAFERANGDILFSSSSSNCSSGILYYDYSSDTVTQIFSGGNRYNHYFELPSNDILISSDGNDNSYGRAGVLLFDNETRKISWLYQSKYNWSNYYLLDGDSCLITSNDSKTDGILYYDATNKTISKVYNSGTFWNIFNEDDNGVEISSIINDEQGKVYFDFETKTCTLIVEEDEETTEPSLVA